MLFVRLILFKVNRLIVKEKWLFIRKIEFCLRRVGIRCWKIKMNVFIIFMSKNKNLFNIMRYYLWYSFE